MVVLTSNKSPRSVMGTAMGDLCLRVVGTSRHRQLVRLSAAKCTIGSAQGCTLRLLAAGIRPLHVLLMRGSRGMVARCWSHSTLLNGQRFSDALLVAGDRLRVGPVELEVLAAGGPASTDNDV